MTRQSSQGQKRAKSEEEDGHFEKTSTEKSERERLQGKISLNNTFTGLCANFMQPPHSEQTVWELEVCGKKHLLIYCNKELSVLFPVHSSSVEREREREK